MGPVFLEKTIVDIKREVNVKNNILIDSAIYKYMKKNNLKITDIEKHGVLQHCKNPASLLYKYKEDIICIINMGIEIDSPAVPAAQELKYSCKNCGRYISKLCPDCNNYNHWIPTTFSKPYDEGYLNGKIDMVLKLQKKIDGLKNCWNCRNVELDCNHPSCSFPDCHNFSEWEEK